MDNITTEAISHLMESVAVIEEFVVIERFAVIEPFRVAERWKTAVVKNVTAIYGEAPEDKTSKRL
ncbi:hypothetical protein ACIPSX_09605 [Pectobacterium sp. CHL-2024]|uniref:hypothetical protein n=1 Tax=Pectobacterium sp. CHL-2024 TaxID=3377079 RepID=UPI00380F1067